MKNSKLFVAAIVSLAVGLAVLQGNARVPNLSSSGGRRTDP